MKRETPQQDIVLIIGSAVEHFKLRPRFSLRETILAKTLTKITNKLQIYQQMLELICKNV